MTEFNEIFNLREVSLKKLKSGNKLRLIFECGENLETEAKLFEFEDREVRAKISLNGCPEYVDKPVIEQTFVLEKISERILKSGNYLRIFLSCDYKINDRIQAIQLRHKDCNIDLKIENNEGENEMNNFEEENKKTTEQTIQAYGYMTDEEIKAAALQEYNRKMDVDNEKIVEMTAEEIEIEATRIHKDRMDFAKKMAAANYERQERRRKERQERERQARKIKNRERLNKTVKIGNIIPHILGRGNSAGK